MLNCKSSAISPFLANMAAWGLSVHFGWKMQLLVVKINYSTASTVLLFIGERQICIIVRGQKFFRLKSSKEGRVALYLEIFESSSQYYLKSYLKRPGQVVQDLLMPRQWHHLCVAINGTSGVMTQILVRKNFCI